MAEEITYIPYGLDEISQQDLMTSLANGVPGYLDSKRWAKKDKYRLAWLSAYLDIVGHGLLGASNSSGLWNVQYGQEPIDLSTKSNIEREMYQDAAYYIQLQMSLMPLRKKEEEKKKEDLEKFGDFGTNLMNQILKGYGNNRELFKDSEQGWDAQDTRGSDGLRGTKNRKDAMIKALSAYKDSLNDKDYNFEETPFKDKADLQTKIQTAIDALKNTPEDESDDLPAFNALGLPYRAFFNNGGNDPYTKGDYTGTYSGYNEYLAEQNKAKQEAEQEKLKLQRANQWKSFRSWDFSKLAGRPLTSEESNSTYLDNLFAKGKWTVDELSLIVSAFKLAELNNQLVGLSKEELSKLPSTWKNRGKYLKRINGLNTPFYYDTLSKQFKLFNNGDLNTKTSFQEILDKNNPEKKKEQEDLTKKMALDKYWNSPIKELDSYDYANVIGALADALSIADPEPLSAATIAEIGTVARSYGRSKNTGFWENVLHTTGDTILGGLAAIPALGDAGLAWRMTGTGLKYLGYAGLIFNAKNLPEAGKAFSKWYNYATQDGFKPVEAYKKLTRKEALDLQDGLLELVGIKGAASGAIARKVTKPITSNTQKVVDVDVKINGKQTKLAVTPEEAKQLRTGITGKLEKANSKLRSTKSAQEYAKKNNVKVEDIEIISAPGRIPLTRNSGMTKRSINIKGTAKPKDFGTIWRPFAWWQSKFNSISNSNNSSENFWTRYFGGYKPVINNSSNNSIILHGNLPQPPEPILNIKKPIPTLGPYYRKQGGTINNPYIDNVIEDFLNTIIYEYKT